MKGVVLRSTGSFYDVLSEEGSTYKCKVRGKIRLEGIKETNPVAVGDRVIFDAGKDIGAITSIEPRENHIIRQSVKKTSRTHVLAANIDQALLVATLAYPRTSLGFIDRFLVTAESFRIPQVIVFNKRDVLDPESLAYQSEITAVYEKLKIDCLVTDARHDDLGGLKNILDNKTTLFAGHSGVGKSTILNRLSPAIKQKVGVLSDFSGKGMHTTTFAEMFPIGEKTFVIDTPGIKEWGINDMNDQEISDYFPEMREIRLNCKYVSRCLHVNEPNCAVIAAIQKREIALSRYESYLSILSGSDNRK